MALPRLNENSQYELTIPSNKEVIHYRPFLVKEQKILLMAMESQDNDQILQAISDTLKSCITEDITDRELATFDIEYLFTQIRSKSVGETTKLNLACSSCETNNETQVNLSEIAVELTQDKVIKLNDTYSLEMRYPFLDMRFVEYFLKIHPILKRPQMSGYSNNTIEKYIIRKTFDTDETIQIDKSILWSHRQDIRYSFNNLKNMLSEYFESLFSQPGYFDLNSFNNLEFL